MLILMIKISITFVLIKVDSIPTLEGHLTPKLYVDRAISNFVDESSFLRLDPDEKLKLAEKFQ